MLIVIQTTFPEYAKIFGVKPNLILVFTICAALLDGSTVGAIIGGGAGLAMDLLSGKLIGLTALLGMYAGVVTGLANKRIFRNNIFVLLISVFATSVFYEGLVLFLNVFFKTGIASLTIEPLIGTILPEALYNCIVSLVIYWFVSAVVRKIELKTGIQR